MPIVTLTTDFGTRDGFVGALKGVVWSICPEAQIADITHEIAPQNIREGAMALWRAYPFFPGGTVHVAVVDPGVGTTRRPIAARLGEHVFVGPDNGLFTPIYEDASRLGRGVEIVHLTNPRYFLPKVSRTFHGRDIFSPVAAHLARGVPFADLGPPVTDPVRIPIFRAERTAGGWKAHISVVDIFGNLTTGGGRGPRERAASFSPARPRGPGAGRLLRPAETWRLDCAGGQREQHRDCCRQWFRRPAAGRPGG